MTLLDGRILREPADANALLWFFASDNLPEGRGLERVQIAGAAGGVSAPAR